MKVRTASCVQACLSVRRPWLHWHQRAVLYLLFGFAVGYVLHSVLFTFSRHRKHADCFLPTRPTGKGKGMKAHRSSLRPGLDLDLLFVGVMTSRRYLRERARAIHRTWGGLLNGSLLFFVGRGEPVREEGLPVHVLEDVSDDEYPPQKKSFAMLKFMHRHLGQRYEWFMRADDDLFVDVVRLRRLLSSVDSSRPRYLGRPGTGRPKEKGKLGLPAGSAYCMGGPGVLVSRGTLAAVAGQADTCLQRVVTGHEDSELGRCVYNSTGLSCANSATIYRLFNQNYVDTTGAWVAKTLRRSRPYVTFHPVKDARYMYHNAYELQSQRISALQSKTRRLRASIGLVGKLLSPRTEPDELYQRKEHTYLCNYFSNQNSSFSNCDGERELCGCYEAILQNPWYLIHENIFYTSKDVALKLPIKDDVMFKELTKALRHLNDYVTPAENAPQNQLIAKSSFYRRITPSVSVEYITFVQVTSSDLRPFLIRHEFEQLILEKHDTV